MWSVSFQSHPNPLDMELKLNCTVDSWTNTTGLTGHLVCLGTGYLQASLDRTAGQCLSHSSSQLPTACLPRQCWARAWLPTPQDAGPGEIAEIPSARLKNSLYHHGVKSRRAQSEEA